MTTWDKINCAVGMIVVVVTFWCVTHPTPDSIMCRLNLC